MHYYQFNIGDYKSHTEHLSEMEDLAYRRLLDWYYLHESPIPLEIDEVARQIRMRSHTDCIAIVLQEFFEQTKEGWVSQRADEEIAKVSEKSQKARASADARWGKKSNKNKGNTKKAKGDANALPAQSDSNATQDTRHITQDTKNTTLEVNRPSSVSAEVWGQFVKQRKAKKAQITGLVMAGIQREADKAGYTLDMALAEIVVRNWTSFKAEWVVGKQTATQKAASNMNLLTRGLSGPKTTNFWAKPVTSDQNTLEMSNEPKRIL